MQKPIIPSFEDQLSGAYQSEPLEVVLRAILDVLKRYQLRLGVVDAASYGGLAAAFSKNQSLLKHMKGYLEIHTMDLLMKMGSLQAKEVKEHGFVSEFVAKKLAQLAQRLFNSTLSIGMSGFCIDLNTQKKNTKGLYIACFIKSRVLYNVRFIPLNKNQFDDQKEYINQVVLACFMVIKEVLFKHFLLEHADESIVVQTHFGQK